MRQMGRGDSQKACWYPPIQWPVRPAVQAPVVKGWRAGETATPATGQEFRTGLLHQGQLKIVLTNEPLRFSGCSRKFRVFNTTVQGKMKLTEDDMSPVLRVGIQVLSPALIKTYRILCPMFKMNLSLEERTIIIEK